MYGFIWMRYFDLKDARKINRKHLSYEEQKEKYDKKIKNADKKHKSIKDGENPLPSKPDSSGLERDYRYRISAAEQDFLKCIFQIVSKLGRRIKTITADNLSREDRELLIEAVNKFSEDPNIHLYMYLNQGSRASVSRFAEYNFNNPQAARIRAAIRDIYTFVQNKKLLKCGADQKTITEIYVLFDDLRQYIESKENAYIDKNEEFKGPLTDESADNFMESVINNWLKEMTPYKRKKAEKAMFGDQEEHK
jgi:vacuolar-type H+-ATPase subunit E/Vma4